MTDPIADYLTRIRNAIRARKRVVDIPASKLKTSITKILYDKGYILNYKLDENGVPKSIIKIALKYDHNTGISAIKDLHRASRPGLKMYAGADNLPRVINGLGIAVISTSNGVMTDKEARQQHIGGEVLCYIY